MELSVRCETWFQTGCCHHFCDHRNIIWVCLQLQLFPGKLQCIVDRHGRWEFPFKEPQTVHCTHGGLYYIRLWKKTVKEFTWDTPCLFSKIDKIWLSSDITWLQSSDLNVMSTMTPSNWSDSLWISTDILSHWLLLNPEQDKSALINQCTLMERCCLVNEIRILRFIYLLYRSWLEWMQPRGFVRSLLGVEIFVQQPYSNFSSWNASHDVCAPKHRLLTINKDMLLIIALENDMRR